MQTQDDIVPVAIIGGGLCGLALASGLASRGVPFKLYEARASFQEIGAGINIGPNAVEALRLIDEDLCRQARDKCVQNPPGKENVWMQIRLGAATDHFEDGKLITELIARPTGNMTAKRNDLLQVLAKAVPSECSVFNKKAVGIEEQKGSKDSSDSVKVNFADGTSVRAGAVIACDGIHSAVRKALLGAQDPASVPQFADSGGYRGLPDMTSFESAVGSELARTSNIIVGPEGYIVMYPIASGSNVNVGLWQHRRSGGVWPGGREWVVPNQGEEMRKHFSRWGPTAHKIMDQVGDAAFWATHHHTVQPKAFSAGRVCLIGDAAHSMPPHQGAGAGQAVEDALVMAELFKRMPWDTIPSSRMMEAAFRGFEAVRSSRAQKVMESSHETLGFWSNFYRRDLTQQDLDEWIEKAKDRFAGIWDARLEDQIADAVLEMNRAYSHAESPMAVESAIRMKKPLLGFNVPRFVGSWG